jgi:ribosomal protein S18 acetylase RimI-like enzyme
MAEVSVETATTVDDELVDAFARLTPQLSQSSPPPGRRELEQIVASPATHVLVARDADRRVIGTLTLVMFRIPTGIRAHIEDVVVDADAVRGRGLRTGEALTAHALDLARREGAKTVDLTSRPSREAANSLYQRLGFTQRETNVYRLDL